MKVTISTLFARVTVEMGTVQAMDLMLEALRQAEIPTPETAEPVACEEQGPTTIEIITEPEETEDPEDIPAAPTPVKTKKKVETMFGDRSSWNTPAVTKTPTEENTDEPKKFKKYKGFMHLKCEACGETKGFFTKLLTDNFRCACGHETKLKDMKPVHVKCRSCGNYIRYWTNVDTDRFEMNCLHCHAPIDLELNYKRGEYDSL